MEKEEEKKKGNSRLKRVTWLLSSQIRHSTSPPACAFRGFGKSIASKH